MSKHNHVNPAIASLINKLHHDQGNIESIMVVVNTKTGNQYVQTINKTKMLGAGK